MKKMIKTCANPVNLSKHSRKTRRIWIYLGLILTLNACQSLTPTQTPKPTTPPSDATESKRLQSFSIFGKMGIITPATDTQKAQAHSAFYTWTQEDNRFAIEITGALGIGNTQIFYDGQTATLINAQTGKITAQDPENLLEQLAQWQAPISQLAYWISGKPAPSDHQDTLDPQKRLITAQNGDWIAQFTYEDTHLLPNKISIKNAQGNKVTFTIQHRQTN